MWRQGGDGQTPDTLHRNNHAFDHAIFSRPEPDTANEKILCDPVAASRSADVGASLVER
jgi:hypothetical protein